MWIFLLLLQYQPECPRVVGAEHPSLQCFLPVPRVDMSRLSIPGTVRGETGTEQSLDLLARQLLMSMRHKVACERLVIPLRMASTPFSQKLVGVAKDDA